MLKITQADRSLGTDRVMVFGPDMVSLTHLQGRQYSEVRSTILRLTDSGTKFCHRIMISEALPIKVVEVIRDEW